MNRLARLIALNAKADDIIHFRYPDDNDDQPGIIKKAATAGAVGAAGLAGAGGLYAAGAMGSLRSKTGLDLGASGLTGAQTLDKLNQNIGSIGQGGATDIAATIGRGAQVVGKDAKSGLAAILSKLRAVKLSIREDRLVELNAKLDKIVKLAA